MKSITSLIKLIVVKDDIIIRLQELITVLQPSITVFLIFGKNWKTP